MCSLLVVSLNRRAVDSVNSSALSLSIADAQLRLTNTTLSNIPGGDWCGCRARNLVERGRCLGGRAEGQLISVARTGLGREIADEVFDWLAV